MSGCPGIGGGFVGLLVEGDDAPVRRRISMTPKSRASSRGTGMAATVASASRSTWRCDHLAHVHLVDVVAAEDADDAPGFSSVMTCWHLVDGVGRAAEPALAGALLRGDRLDELVEHRREPPAARDVLLERRALVLGEDLDRGQSPELTKFERTMSMMR